MRKERVITGALVLVLAFAFMGCTQPTDSDDPEITGFTFTPTAGLQEGNDNVKAAAVAGRFSNPEGGTGPFTYALAAGTGDTDNAQFWVDAADLKIKANALTAKTYRVYIKVTDSKNKTYGKSVAIEVVSTVPTDFTFLQTPGLREGNNNAKAGQIAGSFSNPAGGTGPFTYTLVTGNETNDVDNDKFEINDVNLKIKGAALTAKEYKIYAQVEDAHSKTYAKAAVITVVASSAEYPGITDFTFTATPELRENTTNTVVGAIAGSFSNPEGGTAPFTYALFAGNGTNDADNGQFEINGVDLKIKGSALTNGTKRVNIKITDSFGKTYAEAVTLTVLMPLSVLELSLPAGFVAETAFPSSATYADAAILPGGTKINVSSKSATTETATLSVSAYTADHQEYVVSGLKIKADGSFDESGKTAALTAFSPVYASGHGAEAFTAAASAAPGTTIYVRGASYPTPDASTGRSNWNIKEGVTLVLVSPGQMHMHTLYNYTGPGTFKMAAGTKIMLPGGKPANTTDSFQVSTLEIGGTLWVETPFVNASADLIYGAMTSPGGIVRLLDGSKVTFGETPVETVTVTGGAAYFHTIVKHLVIGKSTVTITNTISLGAVTGTEKASYPPSGTASFTMDSDKMGLGSGGTLVINAPGKTVSITGLDAANIGAVKVMAGTLAVTGSITNAAGKVTISQGAAVTVNGSTYVPDSPPITNFTFTPASGLQEETDSVKTGAVVGTFSSPVGGTAPYTYSLISGDGVNNADNNKFTIEGTNLKVGAAALIVKEHKIYVCITDAGGKTFAKALTVTVSPLPELTGFTFTPTAGLKHNTDNTAANTVAGTFGTELGGTPGFTYALVAAPASEAGKDADNAKFDITGKNLTIKALTVGSYQIYVQVTDSKGKKFAKALPAISVAVNKDALTAAVTAAQTAVDSITVNTSADNVSNGTSWVTAAVKTAYQSAVTAAKAVANNVAATQTEIDTAVTNLAAATTTFNTAKGTGTKVSIPVEFVSIPGGTVVGSDDYRTPEPYYGIIAGYPEYNEGAFPAGRTVTISSFKMAKTPISYEKWHEVYTWATDDARGSNKYFFANKGKEGASQGLAACCALGQGWSNRGEKR